MEINFFLMKEKTGSFCTCLQENGASVILRDIARARENIQKSLAGVSTAAGYPRLALAPRTPSGAADSSPSAVDILPLEQSQGEVCGAVFLPGHGPGPRPPQETPAHPCRASRLLAGAHWVSPLPRLLQAHAGRPAFLLAPRSGAR